MMLVKIVKMEKQAIKGIISRTISAFSADLKRFTLYCLGFAQDVSARM